MNGYSPYALPHCEPSSSKSGEVFLEADKSQKKKARKPASKKAKDEVSSVEPEEARDPIVFRLKNVALKVMKSLEQKIMSEEEEEGRTRLNEAILGSLITKPMEPAHLDLIELPQYYCPWNSPVDPTRNQAGELVPELDYVPKTFLIGDKIDSQCGPAFELPKVVKLPGTFAWSSLPRNEMTEDERVISAVPTIDSQDNKFIKEYAKEFANQTEFVGCRRYRNLLLTEKRIASIVEPVAADFSDESDKSAGSISEKVFEAISEALGGTESPVGILHRYYRAKGQPREAYLQNLNASVGKPPTVARFLDSCNRLLCNRCHRYDCLEHPFKTNRPPKVFPPTPPAIASTPCDDLCHKNRSTSAVKALVKPVITLADKVILNSFMTESEETKYSYCDMAKYVDHPCAITYEVIKELLASPDATTPEDLNGIAEHNRRGRTKVNHRRFTSAPTARRMRKEIKDNGRVTQYQYIPCSHSYSGSASCKNKDVCGCVDRNNFCERYCDCSANCVNKFGGCNCVGDCKTIRCPCYVVRRECDPEVCKCAAKSAKEGCCKNTAILFNSKRKVKCGPSDVHGWGAFIMEDTKCGDFISEYTGEVISQEEAERRGKLYDHVRVSYLFDLNLEYVVDAARKGNKIRYANHSKFSPNCYPEIYRVQGDHRIGIFARRDLVAGEELFFDYSYSAESLKFVQIEPTKKNGNSDYRVACIAQNVDSRTKKAKPKKKKIIEQHSLHGVEVNQDSVVHFREKPVDLQCEFDFLDESTGKHLDGDIAIALAKDFEVVEPCILKPKSADKGFGKRKISWNTEATRTAYHEFYPCIDADQPQKFQGSEVWNLLSSMVSHAEKQVGSTGPVPIVDESSPITRSARHGKRSNSPRESSSRSGIKKKK